MPWELLLLLEVPRQCSSGVQQSNPAASWGLLRPFIRDRATQHNSYALLVFPWLSKQCFPLTFDLFSFMKVLPYTVPGQLYRKMSKGELWNRSAGLWPQQRCTLTCPEVEQTFKGKKRKKTSRYNRDTRHWKGHFQQQLRKTQCGIAKSFVFSRHRANATFNRNMFDGSLVLVFFWFLGLFKL